MNGRGQMFLALLAALLLLVIPTVLSQNCCGVADVNILVHAPNDQTRLYTDCQYVETTGSCSDASASTVRYTCDIGYSFCPVEGIYDANVYVLADSNCFSCGSSYVLRVQTIENFYEVNYDASEGWCRCLLDMGYWSLGGEVAPASCCGDDPGEYRRECTGDTVVCNASSDNVACCDSPSDCVFDGMCYPSGTGFVSVGEGTFVCDSGSWTNCLPPVSADWNIISTCTVSSAINVAANIWIKAGGLLHILSGGTVAVNGGYIFVLPGGEIVVEPGGEITK